MRNASTQPQAVMRHLRRFVPPAARLYIGTTERPDFFLGAMSQSYRLLFASNFSEQLQSIRNNYALYAVESLLFVGADLYMETFGYTRGNFMRGCFPYGSPDTYGVSYGKACSRACHEELHLLPPPTRHCRRDRRR